MINSRRIKWAGHVGCMEQKGNAHRILMGKPERRRCKRRLEDNIKKDFGDSLGGMDWTDLAKNRDRWRALVNTVP
jgi:hypothetical protein